MTLPRGRYVTEAGSVVVISGERGERVETTFDWVEEPYACCECVVDPYPVGDRLTWECTHCGRGSAQLRREDSLHSPKWSPLPEKGPPPGYYWMRYWQRALIDFNHLRIVEIYSVGDDDPFVDPGSGQHHRWSEWRSDAVEYWPEAVKPPESVVEP